MIVLDVNVLVYAARREFEQHEMSAGWLARQLSGSEAVVVPDQVLVSAMRLLTNHRVLARPLTGEQALSFCDAVRSAPAVLPLGTSATRWRVLSELVTDLGLRGNHMPDALLAAAAIDLRASLATFDRGFRRFPGLHVLEPSL